ncbi:MAG: hypothetical protein ACLPP9_12785 [Smithella sp.]
MPAINQPISQANKKYLTCPSPFLKEKYRLIYEIEIRAAGNVQGAIIGITVADPSTRFICCAIMTAEGIVLFDAQAGPNTLKINRALPPFNSADFAKNMIEDIKLISFAPEGKIQTKGRLPDGSTVCRYSEQNGDWIDVIADKSDLPEINRYSSDESLKRHVQFNKPIGNIYKSIELQGSGMVNYTLLMTLIEAQRAKGK